MEGEVSIGNAEAADEMVFKGLDGPFGGVNPVVVGFDDLEGAPFVAEEVGNWCAGLIVGHVEERAISAGCEVVVDLFEGGDDGIIGRGRYGNCEDVICVIVVCDKEIVVTIE